MYIHHSICISPQHTFSNVDLDKLNLLENNMLRVIEPKYEDISLSILRRMGKAVRLGVGAAIPLIKKASSIDGVIIGTANGGMEDCIKFLNQVLEFEEGRLTPTNFVQSTPNAIASQIGLMATNNGYNITHVHRGLAFENALIDSMMLLKENPHFTLLLGGIDEISTYNYNIENLSGLYKKEEVCNSELYLSETSGTIAGEGVAIFLVNNIKENALAKVSAVKTLHTHDVNEVFNQLKLFIKKEVDGHIDLFVTGENGDNRLRTYFDLCENFFDKNTGIARYKHYCGEFPSASAISLWLACNFLTTQNLPEHFIKKRPANNVFKKILIYNNFKGEQHSFMLVELVESK